ncbi:hypothetical protein GIB67_021837 [Kingdonia uniflora]|uniref:Uncharacterized protein n=1 Tax=Kingdonia uniflora TaxID=39325 RepID=A0A7J7P7T8_9MAGN|nr:hypothetical protein GIB67_021837 [Kingdonia uniflora]
MSNNKDTFDMDDLRASLLPGATAALSSEDRKGLVDALKDKLQSLAGQHPDVLETLSPNRYEIVNGVMEVEGVTDELLRIKKKIKPLKKEQLGQRLSGSQEMLNSKAYEKKPKKGSKSAKPITKTESCESFFNFFSPPEVPDDEDDLTKRLLKSFRIKWN